MTALLPPLPAVLGAWFRGLLRALNAAAASRRSRETPRDHAMESAALDRLLPMMLGNAPHPYQASLLLYLMDEERRQKTQPRR